jgi:hypothetical protein|tara:strand:- start:160 stop:2181 length:2022 start_codon:yes stop_codon:yes gene_type:complete
MDDLKTSPFSEFSLHDTWFDWSDPRLDAQSISKKLMGPVNYWNEPEFGEVYNKEGELIREAMPPHEIEREILFEAGREQWAYESAYGKPYYQHFLTLMALLDDDTDITPTIADATQLFCMSFANNIKVLNLIGSQNAGKSAGSVRIAFCCFYIDPEYTSIYVLNPFKTTAESTVWGDMLDMWDKICTTHPHPDKEGATYLFPDGYVYQDRYITAVPKLAKAGFIKVQDPKVESKFKGTKTKKTRADSKRGLILHIFDEVNESQSFAYLKILGNISSQNFISITSQNFKSEDDLGGFLCEPVMRYQGDKDKYDDLAIDLDHVWSSNYRSMTLRFDGKRAANMLAGRIIYDYLFNQSDWDRLAELGMNSPDFASQARSFPIRGESANSVLSKSKISQSQYKDPWFTTVGQPIRVAFCDPAFGGRDKAKWGYAEFGPALVKDENGANIRTNIFQVKTYFKTLKIVKDAIYNNYWADRMRECGIDDVKVVMGAEVSVEDQIAIQCAEFNLEFGIDSTNFGYDFSMRPDIVSSMNKFLGFDTVAFDYNSGVEGYYLESYKKSTTDYCYDRVTELCFITSDLFNSRQFRGGEFCDGGITQLSRTKYEDKNKKKKCQNKREYKAEWKGTSPDDRDVLIGLGGMAAKRGMSTKSLSKVNNNGNSAARSLRERLRKKKAKRI